MITTKKKILLLSGFFPKEISGKIVSKSKSNTQFAADALQWSLVQGLVHYYDVTVANFPFIGAYPFLSDYLRLDSVKFSESRFHGLSFGYMNIVLFKNADIYRRASAYLDAWSSSVQGDKVIVVYSAFLPFVKAALRTKKRYSDVKVCIILPDLIEFTNKPRNFLYRIFRDYTKSQLDRCYENIDGFVLLSKYMTEKLPIGGAPWVVVEGIYNGTEVSATDSTQQGASSIVYTGTLARRYGVLNLVRAFEEVIDPNVKLIICGDGDAKEEIEQAAARDKRIHFEGMVERAEALSLQRKATLLVNPRTPEGTFTKYSFPSKTMEYLASGVPALLYRLPGIPDEYFEYCFTPKDSSITALKSKIEEVLRMDPAERAHIARKAKDFILEKKNPIVQCAKIVDLIEKQL